MALIGGCMTFVYRTLFRVEMLEHQPNIGWLPPTATDVSAFRSYPWTAYEFDIGESDFHAWAAVNGYKVERIGPEPVHIRRYLWAKGKYKEPSPLKGWPSAADLDKYEAQMAQYRTDTRRTVTNGFVYTHGQSNGGFCFVVYDLDFHRTYVETSPR